MFIDIVEIRKSPGQTFHFNLEQDIPPLTLGTDEVRIDKPVGISLDVKNTGKVLVFSGKLIGDTELVCSRCLETYPFHLDAVFEEKFCHAADLIDVTEDGIDTEDMHVFEGNRVDIDDIINENIVLAIPMKSICSDACQGLCAVCGTNLNKSSCNCEVDDIDPRLADLKKFFDV